MAGSQPPEPDPPFGAGHQRTPGGDSNGVGDDLLEGGSGRGRRIPKPARIVIEVALGAAIAALIGVPAVRYVWESTSSVHAALEIGDERTTTQGNGRASVHVELRNTTENALFLDLAAVVDAANGVGSNPYAPAWVSATIYPTDQSLDPHLDNLGQDLEVAADGGTAELVVSVAPPCPHPAFPRAVEVVVAWHTESGGLGQTFLPRVLDGDNMRLADLVETACAADPAGGRPRPMAPELLATGEDYAGHIVDAQVWFSVPGNDWYRTGDIVMAKSATGAAESQAQVLVTDIDHANGIRACGQWWGSPFGTIRSWALQAAQTRGTRVVVPPEVVLIDGYAAQHLVVRATSEKACGPGLHHTWNTTRSNTMWSHIETGDIVRIWILQVGPQGLYIEADTHQGAESALRQEVTQIIESIRLS